MLFAIQALYITINTVKDMKLKTDMMWNTTWYNLSWIYYLCWGLVTPQENFAPLIETVKIYNSTYY